MTEHLAPNDFCQHVDSAAYLDGELDVAAAALFERHLQDCAACAAALLEQRRLLCLLDTAFSERSEKRVTLPANFARVITARAQTDMSGVRRKSEHRVAFKICVALAVAAFALMGAAAFDVVLVPLVSALRAMGSVLGMIGHALVNAGAGAVLILRAVGGRLVAEPSPIKYFQWVLFVGAALLLLRLVGNYHRAKTNDQGDF